MTTRIRIGRAGRLLTIAAMVASLLTLASTAGASNATLRTSVNSWSRTVGIDAHSVALAAHNRHPRRMTSSAVRFRTDALRARAAVAHQRPSTTGGNASAEACARSLRRLRGSCTGLGGGGTGPPTGATAPSPAAVPAPRRSRLAPETSCSWRRARSSARCSSRRWMFIRDLPGCSGRSRLRGCEGGSG